MTSSLRDALRQSGVLDQFKPVERTPRKPAPGKGKGDGKRARHAGGGQGRLGGGHRASPEPSRSQEEIDLAKAYALRAQAELREREAKARAEREVAERRRIQREQVQALLDGCTLNRGDAEIARHFEYGGKIRRVYVDEAQLQQVNKGELGVIQMRGRYLLVERALAERIRAVDDKSIALLVDPDPDSPGDDPES